MAGISFNIALSIKAGALLMLPGFLAVLVVINQKPLKSLIWFLF
jgi:hypothetical protein